MQTAHDHHPFISYDDRGVGDPAVLCLPGWCGDRSVFAPFVEAMSAHRRALALDWRGHGESTRDVADFGNNELLTDALDVIDHAGTGQVVPVALAHAGWVAIELRRQLGPQRVPAIVLVDWMVLGPPPGFTGALAGLQDPAAWEQVRAALFGMWTSGVTSAAVLDYVTSMGQYGFDHWARAGREIAAAFAEHGTPLTALQDVADRGEPCPTLHVYAQPRDDGFFHNQQAFSAEHEWFSVERFDARSHFPVLEAPQSAAAVVERFVRAQAAQPDLSTV